jgi:putative transposase
VSVSDLKRLKDLEAENGKLKRMYADLALENTAIKDVLNRNVWSASLLQGQKTSDGDSSH